MNAVLALLWKGVVDPVLKSMKIETTPDTTNTTALPRITWCATGPLAFLPLHAAGEYGIGQSVKAADFIVSSYTSSLSSLLHIQSRPQHSTQSSAPKVLVVSQPSTPGQRPLPGTFAEVAIIKERLPLATGSLNDNEATVSGVLEHMGKYNSIHLACHGIQNLDDPIQSAFALYDGQLTLAQLMNTTLADAELAVLSACQTATGESVLSDEAVHLTAGMIAVGYKSVIGTMWSIGDEDAPKIADVFYSRLVEDPTRPAHALHEAVKYLREQVGEDNFARWVPFVHFGM